MKLVDKLWWSRFCLAWICAFLAAYLFFLGMANTWVVFGIAIAVYALTYIIPRYFYRIDLEALPKRRDIWLAGAFPYLVLWFTFWIFFYTMLRLYSGT